MTMTVETRFDHDGPVEALLADYVLDLLGPAERARVERALRRDPALRQALRAERQIGADVRATIGRATQPPWAALQRRRPDPPRSAFGPHYQRALAAACCLLLLFLGALTWQSWSQTPLSGPPVAPPTALSATATMTRTPAVTISTTEAQDGGLTVTATEHQPAGPAATTASSNGQNRHVIPDSSPLATPIAALSTVAQVDP